MKKSNKIKCVVWDLDNTLWDGILLEGDDVILRPGIADIIKTLDSRGILNSIASKNNYEDAMAKLKEFGLEQYFLYPEINWNAKSDSIEHIKKNLNIGMNTILFIDDQKFEREEVKFVHHEILCMDAREYSSLLNLPLLTPRFITKDASRRRDMYIEDQKRKKEENEFTGPKAEFLASLDMQLVIAKAQEEDLKRAEELTVRTNQLNTTGRTYSYKELKDLIHSERHSLLIGELIDKHGTFGKIGLALIEKTDEIWLIKLFLMSCRVMAYGIGTIFLTHILQLAKEEGKKVRAEFIQTKRNRLMYITFKFSNFKEIATDKNGNIIFENDLSIIQKIPAYIRLVTQRKEKGAQDRND